MIYFSVLLSFFFNFVDGLPWVVVKRDHAGLVQGA